MSNPRVRFLLDGWSAFFRDRPRYSASVLQMFVRGVDDDIHRFDGDVALYDLEALTCCKSALKENGIHSRKDLLHRGIWKGDVVFSQR